MNRRKQYTPEQIVKKPRDADPQPMREKRLTVVAWS